MLGAPASGKGTQAARIASHFRLPNLSTGALIRSEQQRGSNLGALADNYLAGGGFLPDDLMAEIMTTWLQESGAGGFVLDGFPRTLPQAENFDAFLASAGQRLDAVILLEADLETLHRRIGSRVHCTRCGGTFQLNATIVPSGDCPKVDCQGRLEPRSDDQPEPYAGRLANYHKLTKPLIEHYEQGGGLRRVDGNASQDEVFETILNQLGVPLPASPAN
ncbi:MAG: adenylate kinase [Verrucomicrobiales bacterium]|jgi:adenylate kinase